MESKELLGKILQRFRDNKKAQVAGYYVFGYIRETNSSVYVTRESGEDTSVSFKKIITGIEAYQRRPSLYDEGPTSLREFGITHVTSPVFALLHLLPKSEYER